MKIISYNINGLNAFVNNGKFDNLIKEHTADVYCFQEIKMDTNTKAINKLNESKTFVDYNYKVSTSLNCIKKGYSGVLTLFNNDVKNIIKEDFPIMESITNNNYLYIPGRILTTEYKDFYLVNVYVVNSGKKDELRKQWDIYFCNFIKLLQLTKPVVIVGDLNVCSTEYDYWGNYKTAINSSPGLMDYEIEGFNNLVNTCNLIDVFRYKHGNERKYSWYSFMGKALEKNHGWRIDYVLVSNSLKDKIIDCDILSGYQGADHSPIFIDLSI